MKFKRILLAILFCAISLNTACGTIEDDDSYANYGDISSVEENNSSIENTSISDTEISTIEDTSVSDTEISSDDTSNTNDETTVVTSTSKDEKSSTTTSVKSSTTTTATSKTNVSKVTTAKVTTTSTNDNTPIDNPQNNVEEPPSVENTVEENTIEEPIIDVTEATEEVQTSDIISNGIFEDSDMSLTYNGQSISVDMYMTDILALIGEPYDYQSNFGCYNEWNDEIYMYDGIQIDANTYDGNTYQARIITVLNNSVVTSKGITIGSTFEDMKNAYGEQYLDLDTTYIYTASNGSSLYFMVDDNKIITSISYYSYNI